MTVKFETIAQVAPTDLAFEVWISIPTSSQTDGITVNWSDDTNGQAHDAVAFKMSALRMRRRPKT